MISAADAIMIMSQTLFILSAFESISFGLAYRIHLLTSWIHQSSDVSTSLSRNKRKIHQMIQRANKIVDEVESHARSWRWIILALELTSGSVFLFALYVSLFGRDLNLILRLAWMYGMLAFFVSF